MLGPGISGGLSSLWRLKCVQSECLGGQSVSFIERYFLLLRGISYTVSSIRGVLYQRFYYSIKGREMYTWFCPRQQSHATSMSG